MPERLQSLASDRTTKFSDAMLPLPNGDRYTTVPVRFSGWSVTESERSRRDYPSVRNVPTSSIDFE